MTHQRRPSVSADRTAARGSHSSRGACVPPLVCACRDLVPGAACRIHRRTASPRISPSLAFEGSTGQYGGTRPSSSTARMPFQARPANPRRIPGPNRSKIIIPTITSRSPDFVFLMKGIAKFRFSSRLRSRCSGLWPHQSACRPFNVIVAWVRSAARSAAGILAMFLAINDVRGFPASISSCRSRKCQ